MRGKLAMEPESQQSLGARRLTSPPGVCEQAHPARDDRPQIRAPYHRTDCRGAPGRLSAVCMISPVDTELDDLAADFDLLGDWEERYRHVIDLGRELEPLAETERSDANKVRGCASQVWLVREETTGGRLRFRGDSDAHIVR